MFGYVAWRWQYNTRSGGFSDRKFGFRECWRRRRGGGFCWLKPTFIMVFPRL